MLNLEIVTPEAKVFDDAVDIVTVPTEKGEIGVMQNHAPLISALRSGVLSYTIKGATSKLAVSGGFVEISNNKVSVLADFADRPEDIDVDSARSEKDSAEKALGAWKSDSGEDFDEIKERIEIAQAKISVASGR